MTSKRAMNTIIINDNETNDQIFERIEVKVIFLSMNISKKN